MATKKDSLAQYYFHEGTNSASYDYMGAHINEKKNTVTFRTWAPNADCVYIAADFNGWKKKTPMNRETDGGIFSIELDRELFSKSDYYKYLVSSGGKDTFKADPYGFFSQELPDTATRIYNRKAYVWNDDTWLKYRRKTAKAPSYKMPMNIYELHLGSWKKKEDGASYNYRDSAVLIASYVKEMGYTHIKLLPVTEHPFDGSFGYQSTGYFAPTSRYGSPDDFKYFVDYMHSAGIGVILDIPLSNIAKDVHGLCEFDGTLLYETREQNFDVSKNEVKSFVLSSAMFWLREYHVDGLHLTAAQTYIDDDFLTRLCQTVKNDFSDVLLMIDRADGYRRITRPVEDEGFGFTHKWNTGWTNDVLEYMGVDPGFRKHHHEKMTFSMMYAYNENFVLSVSHSDVVDGKRALLDKASGDYWQKFAQDRAFLSYMMTHPGKKLLFMGCELGQFKEWDYTVGTEWFLLDYDMHYKLQHFVRDLNFTYLENPSLWELDHSCDGFSWIDYDNRDESLLSYIRYDKKGNGVVVIVNMSPIGKYSHIFGVEDDGEYVELINSDDMKYGGTGMVNGKRILACEVPHDDKPYSIKLDIGPYGAAILKNIKNKIVNNSFGGI